MGNVHKRKWKPSRKGLPSKKIGEEKEKARERSCNHRHSTGDSINVPTPPPQLECRNSTGETRNDTSQQESKWWSVTMDTPFSTSIPIVSTNLKSIDATLIYNSVKISMDETPRGASNPSSSTPWCQCHSIYSWPTEAFYMGRKVPLNAYKWMKAHFLPWKVIYLNALSNPYFLLECMSSRIGLGLD